MCGDEYGRSGGSPEVSGKKALAVAAFGRALREIPTILANNAGLDGVELTAQLRAAHHRGDKNAGLDMWV